MYESFFGLREKPFSLLPDPSFLYLSDVHSAALSMLQYGLQNRVGITVLTGEVGSGKTTLMRYLIGELGPDISVGMISNTHPSLGEVMDWVCSAFALRPREGSQIARHDAFVEFLQRQNAQGKRTLLVIDEAQNLGIDRLEEIRLLSNINTGKNLLLQLFLLGQNQLRERLRRPELEQFVQRIGASYHLGRLAREETFRYIRHRLAHAGNREIFTPDACAAVHHYSQGLPRIVNTICETALVYAFAADQGQVSGEMIDEFARSDTSPLMISLDSVSQGPRERFVPNDNDPVFGIEALANEPPPPTPIPVDEAPRHSAMQSPIFNDAGAPPANGNTTPGPHKSSSTPGFSPVPIVLETPVEKRHEYASGSAFGNVKSHAIRWRQLLDTAWQWQWQWQYAAGLGAIVLIAVLIWSLGGSKHPDNAGEPDMASGTARPQPRATARPASPPAASTSVDASQAEPAVARDPVTSAQPAPAMRVGQLSASPPTAALDDKGARTLTPPADQIATGKQSGSERLDQTADNSLLTIEKALRQLPIRVLQTGPDALQLDCAQTIHFDNGSANLDATARSLLEGLATRLRAADDLHIGIVAHTDSSGSASRNRTLSQQRAETIGRYLSDRGIPAERISTVGKGEDELRYSLAEEAQRGPWINRRIEINLSKE